MLVILRFTVSDVDRFTAEAEEALAALSACPGYERGQLGQAYDDSAQWCLVTEWSSVGAYRGDAREVIFVQRESRLFQFAKAWAFLIVARDEQIRK